MFFLALDSAGSSRIWKLDSRQTDVNADNDVEDDDADAAAAITMTTTTSLKKEIFGR